MDKALIFNKEDLSKKDDIADLILACILYGERSTGAAERADAGTSRNGIAGHLAPVSFGTGDEGYGSCRSRFSQGKATAGETGILAEAVREEVKN